MAASHVVVVGAGLAGLSAGLELKARGHEVHLIERSRLLGGKATSFELGGVEVDNGQHVFLACCTEFIDFVTQAVAGADGAIHSPGSCLYLQDRFDALLLAPGRAPARLRATSLSAPLHLAAALLRYRYLTLAERFRVGVALSRAERPINTHETFDAWLRRHGQNDNAFTAFWNPFFVPALNAPLDEVSAESALFVIRTAFLHDAGAARFGYSTVPLARIAGAAAAQLDAVRTRTTVTGVVSHQDAGGATHLDALQLDDGSEMACDGVVLALPPDRLEKVIGSPQTLGLPELSAFRTAPIIDVHLWYDVPAFGFGFAALLGSPVQWVFEKAPGYLCCSMSAAGEYIGMPGAQLVELCHRELAAVLPQLRGREPRRGAATRDREATFIPSPGLQRPGNQTACRQVVIAGSWTDTGWPATMESAVRSGRRAAHLLSAALTVSPEVPVG